MRSRRSSDYRHRVIIEKKTITRGAAGQSIESWATFGTYSAAIERAYKGSESFRESTDVRVAITFFWIRTRYYSALSSVVNPSDYRWKFGTRIFDIIGMEDPDGTQDELHFLCKEIQA